MKRQKKNKDYSDESFGSDADQTVEYDERRKECIHEMMQK